LLWKFDKQTNNKNQDDYNINLRNEYLLNIQYLLVTMLAAKQSTKKEHQQFSPFREERNFNTRNKINLTKHTLC
jgi:hypothetical protein